MAKQKDRQTYWDGEPCEVERVVVVVGKSDRPTWWCAHLEGQKRTALKVTKPGYEPFYVEDEPDVWLKMYLGGYWNQGSHKSLPVAQEADHA